jgi:N-ethylmaleimide reductase
MNKLLMPFAKGQLSLKNHLVMAPMTRSRAIGNLPNHLMAEYYSQRNGAGLIITEGTAPMPAGLGYPRIPGVFSKEQIKGWKLIADAIHPSGAKIFMQLMHTGRIGHTDNLPEGVKLMGVSAIRAAGQIFTDTNGLQDHSEPTAFTAEEIKELIAGHVNAAKNAYEAGFDGIELHGANGYLIEQFLNPNVNNRTDEYGGNIVNRVRIVLDFATGIADAIGKDKVGIRFSPYSEMGDLQPYQPNEVHETYVYLASELNSIGIAYLHIAMSPKIPQHTLDAIRANFDRPIIICNGLTPATAVDALGSGFADLTAFGRSWLANPDLDERIAYDSPLNQPDFTTLYTPGPKGYTDYPVLVKR